MKHLLIFGLALLSTTLFSQNKKTYYFNEDLNPITKKAFWKDKKDGRKLHLMYDLDTAVMYVKVMRQHRGQISQDSLALLKKDLEASAHHKIDAKDLIVIDYYPGEDACNSSGTSDSVWIKNRHDEYLKNLHSIAPIAQFYIYGKMEGLERYNGIITWYPDLNARVQNNFFQLHYPCGSFVVIRPDGRFFSNFGEYSREYVCERVKQLISE